MTSLGECSVIFLLLQLACLVMLRLMYMNRKHKVHDGDLGQLLRRSHWDVEGTPMTTEELSQSLVDVTKFEVSFDGEGKYEKCD